LAGYRAPPLGFMAAAFGDHLWWFVVCAAITATAADSSRARVSPVEKVVELLTKLKDEVETAGASEAKTYGKFSCFCKKKSMSLSKEITESQDKIEEDSATMEEKTAENGDKKVELKEATGKLEELEANLQKTTAECEQEKEEYEAANADTSKGIAALVNAVKVLKTSKSGKEGLLAVTATVKQSLAIADALKIISDGPKWAAASAFLQSKVDPDDPEYKFHSKCIISVLEKLEEEFRQQKEDQDDEWKKTEATCDETKKDLGDQISSTKDLIDKLATEIDKLTELVAETRGELVDEQASLQDSRLYMKDLSALCEKRANEWDQRTTMRGGEVEALSKALKILKGKVSDTDEVNERALLQYKSVQAGRGASHESKLSFLQNNMQTVRRSLSSSETKAQVRLQAAGENLERGLLTRALTSLRKEGRRLGSTTLSTLAEKAAEDPFKKVKTLIQKLIERLLKEATDEASKKGFCDKELGKAKSDRKFRWQEVQKLNGELRTLEAKKTELELEIDDLKDSLKELKEALKEATGARKKDKTQNLADIETANEGIQAVSQAIMVLKSFYSSAAKAETLMQTHASPVDEDNPGAGFDGAYKGSQSASGGILGLLDVIKSDYARTLKVTTKDEEEAQAAFVKFDQASKVDISGKTTKLDLDKDDLKTTTASIKMKTKEMEENMDLVDKALEAIEELKPMCIDTGMSYEERVAKREEEMKALKKALCILDPEEVEEECED